MYYTLEEMIEDAKEIQAFADADYCSDRELETRAAKFKAKYNVQWFEVI